MVHSLVISKIEYCNTFYFSLPNYLLRKLQSVINRSARLMRPSPSCSCYLIIFIELHQFPVEARIEFKICVSAFKALKFGEPKYLADLLNLQNVHVGMGLRISDDPFRQEVSRVTFEQCFSERAFLCIAPCLLFSIGCLPH